MQPHHHQVGTTPGSWAAVATWRRYFGRASEQGAERGQWQPDRSTRQVEDGDADKVAHNPKYFGTSREYARSTFTDFFHETRRSAFLAVGRNNSIRFNRSTEADAAAGTHHPVAPSVDTYGTRASTAFSSVEDPRNMFLAQ